MEILATVDESDIGLIHQGQPVRFTVQAYPNAEFRARSARSGSSPRPGERGDYSVVSRSRTRDGRLLPGMTATVEFIVERAEDVLLVPNSALRFRPTEEMRRAAARREQDGRRQARAQPVQTRIAPRRAVRRAWRRGRRAGRTRACHGGRARARRRRGCSGTWTRTAR